MTPRTFAVYVLVALGLLGLVLFFVKMTPVLMLAFAAIVIATAFRASADRLARFTRLPPGVCVGLVVLLSFLVLGLGAYFFGKQVGAQLDQLTEGIREALQRLRDFLSGWPVAQQLLETMQGSADPETLSKVAKGTVTAFGILTDTLLVIVLAIYLAADPGLYRRGLVRLMPLGAREQVANAVDASGVALRKWLLGQLVAMVAVGIATFIGLWAIGMPLAIPLAILSGLLEFVPIVGPIAAAVPGMLIAFAQSPEMALYALLVYIVVQLLEENVLIPVVHRWAVAVPPALGLLSVVVFGLLFGVGGILFAMPLLVVTMVLVQHLYVRKLEGGTTGTR